MDIRSKVVREFARRRARNCRYSLRRFATALGVHHATLYRFVTLGKRCRPDTLARIGATLGLSLPELTRTAIDEHADTVHALVRREDFKTRTRWIAIRTGLTIDQVNIALQQLLHSGRVRMRAAHVWTREGA